MAAMPTAETENLTMRDEAAMTVVALSVVAAGADTHAAILDNSLGTV